jgi:hypothetical protein
MAELNRRDEDPGASTTMFQRFVDEGQSQGAPPPDRTRTIALVVAGGILVGLLVIIMVAVATGS